MRNLLASAMVITMALCFSAGVLLFGGVNPDVAAPMFGFGALAALLWAGRLAFGTGATWKPSPMHWPVLAFLGYAVIRYFGAPVEHDARFELFQIGLCALVYFTAANCLHRPQDRTILLVVLMVLVVFESGFALVQSVTKTDQVFFWTRPEGYRGRGSGSYICPNNLAALLELALGLILARAAFVHVRSCSLESFTVRKLLVGYAALMAVAGIVITFSRTGWLATLLSVGVLLLWGGWRVRLSWPRIGIATAVLAVMVLAAWKFPPVRDYVTQSFTTGQPGTSTVGLRDTTLGGRVFMWQGTLKMIAERPLFGSGPASWQWLYAKHKHPRVGSHPEHTHNEFLNLASDYGLVGFGLAAWLVAAFFRHALLLSKPAHPPEQRAFAIGSIIGVVALLVHCWFDFALHIPANAVLLALVLGCVAAMDDTRGRFPRAPLAPLSRYALAAALMLGSGALLWFYVPTALGAYYTDQGNGAKKRFILNRDIPYELYLKAIQADPRSPEPYSRIGDMYRAEAVFRIGPEKADDRTRLAREAVGWYAKSLALNPYQTEVLLRQGRAYEMAGEDDKALANYLRAVELEPNNAFNQLCLGIFYRDHGQPEKAYEAFERKHLLDCMSDQSGQLNMIDLRPPE